MNIIENLSSANFETSSSGEHYDATCKYLEELQINAEKNGRNYYWAPLALDYDIPEINDVDYRTSCPLIHAKTLVENDWQVCIASYLLFHMEGLNDGLVIMPAVKVFVEGNTKASLEELTNYAKGMAYLRFAFRDKRRENDLKYFENLCLTHVVSNNVVPIFAEDVERAQAWAQETFPNNLIYATQGKVGEFAFKCWAGERRLEITKIDLEVRNEPDSFDFFFRSPFSKEEFRVDVKTYQETESKKKRKHWNIKETCINGSFSKNVFVFVVIEEQMKYATIVGMLFAEDVEEKGEYYTPRYNYRSGYYQVYEQDLMNPNYVRALFDSYSLFLNGAGVGVSQKTIEESIKDYPMDPIVGYELGYPDPYTLRRGGSHNLRSFATKRGVIPYQHYL